MEERKKRALVVSITNYKQIKAVCYYTVQVAIGSGDLQYLDKRYNQFFSLNERLKLQGYLDLPQLPQKTFLPVRSADKLEHRRLKLTRYLQALISRVDTLNSPDVVRFLHLDRFSPELL